MQQKLWQTEKQRFIQQSIEQTNKQEELQIQLRQKEQEIQRLQLQLKQAAAQAVTPQASTFPSTSALSTNGDGSNRFLKKQRIEDQFGARNSNHGTNNSNGNMSNNNNNNNNSRDASASAIDLTGDLAGGRGRGDADGGRRGIEGGGGFMTGADKYRLEMQKKGQSGEIPRGDNNNKFKNSNNRNTFNNNSNSNGTGRPAKFNAPRPIGEDSNNNNNNNHNNTSLVRRVNASLNMNKGGSGSGGGGDNYNSKNNEDIPEGLQHCEPKLLELVMNEIMDKKPNTTWQEIAGLDFAKQCVKEIVVWPMIRPDLFKGLRATPKGMLLFGPPGTGKTLIGKAIANEAGATFLPISASSLGSKWHGEGEKLVRTLFEVAREFQPSIIFIDEIDSLLSQRSENEFEGSRRVKTEFLVQLDGVSCTGNERVLVVGATNRPQELDEAARRRLVKRLYIPLPDKKARVTLIKQLLSKEKHDLCEADMERIVTLTDGYSGADMRALCTEAAFGPIRSVADISMLETENVRPINLEDFQHGLQQVRASVCQADLQQYVEW